jgi:hypothetical protein
MDGFSKWQDHFGRMTFLFGHDSRMWHLPGKGPSRGTPKLSQATCLAALRIDGTFDLKATVFVGQSPVNAAISFGVRG